MSIRAGNENYEQFCLQGIPAANRGVCNSGFGIPFCGKGDEQSFRNLMYTLAVGVSGYPRMGLTSVLDWEGIASFLGILLEGQLLPAVDPQTRGHTGPKVLSAVQHVWI